MPPDNNPMEPLSRPNQPGHMAQPGEAGRPGFPNQTGNNPNNQPGNPTNQPGYPNQPGQHGKPQMNPRDQNAATRRRDAHQIGPTSTVRIFVRGLAGGSRTYPIAGSHPFNEDGSARPSGKERPGYDLIVGQTHELELEDRYIDEVLRFDPALEISDHGGHGPAEEAFEKSKTENRERDDRRHAEIDRDIKTTQDLSKRTEADFNKDLSSERAELHSREDKEEADRSSTTPKERDRAEAKQQDEQRHRDAAKKHEDDKKHKR